MNRRPFKALLLGMMAVLLLGTFGAQRALNQERGRLGLTRREPLENAPPLLSFTTVALGGFRGLIANALWMRASRLQEEGKYFEMVQLADWITKLEPHYAQVWRFHAWNLAYNISVKFTDPADRWRWVKQGFELLRDRGIPLNPNEPSLYHELAWHFQHKIGWNLDDAHQYYKGAWVQEMKPIFGTGEIDIESLVNPKTEKDRERQRLLREEYKIDPAHLARVEAEYGPLEWRLPEAHAIYWATFALQNTKGTPLQLMHLRRVVYQSMKLMWERGKLTFMDEEKNRFRLAPDMDSFPRVNAAYESMMAAAADEQEKMTRGHLNFLKQAVESLYVHNRTKAAGEWYEYLKTKYPGSVDPPNKPLERFVVDRVLEIAEGRSQVRVNALVEGFIANHFENLALDEDETAEGMLNFARRVHQTYQERTRNQQERVALDPFKSIYDLVLERMLDPNMGLDPLLQSRLRVKLNLPPPRAPAQAGGQ